MENFYFLTHDNVNPYFNIASEEYLLKETNDFYFYIWVNSPAVIVGVNQNTIQEVNLSFLGKNDIKVVRRLTGGGAVYHDLNNLCYTVIAPYNPNENTYEKFSKPVIEYLNSLGVKAEFSGRNDICVDGKKISGSAQTVFGNRIMHHGTLLFKTDMSVLEGALKPNKLKTESKGIKSVRARVTNIYDCLTDKMTIDEFKNGLKKWYLKDAKNYEFSKKDLDRINQLVIEKYSTFSWNIGNSPRGNNTFEYKFSFGIMNINFDIENGNMQNVKITGDFFSITNIEEFEAKVNGTPFIKDKVEKVFEKVNNYIVNANGKEIVDKLFE